MHISERRARTIAVIALVSGLCWAGIPAAPVSAQIAAVRSTPEDGAELDLPVRTVRIWFDEAPLVDKSTLDIKAPGNRARAEGLHSMGENDLMARVVGPMPNGNYVLTWTTAGADGQEQTGTISFTVQRGP